MEGRRRREGRSQQDGDASVAVLFGLFTGTVLAGLWALGEGDGSEAMAWGIASLVLLRWLGRVEKETKHG
jgi:hypothetical protein